MPGLQRKHVQKHLRGTELHFLGNVAVQEHPDHGAGENGISCGRIQVLNHTNFQLPGMAQPIIGPTPAPWPGGRRLQSPQPAVWFEDRPFQRRDLTGVCSAASNDPIFIWAGQLGGTTWTNPSMPDFTWRYPALVRASFLPGMVRAQLRERRQHRRTSAEIVAGH